MGSPTRKGTARSSGPSRRTLLLGGLAGAAGGAAIPLALGRNGAQPDGDADDGPAWEHPAARTYPVTSRTFPFNTGWLFGEYTPGSEQPGFDSGQLDPVTLPHCVTQLSWQKWDPAAWERVWVYRKTLDSTPLRNGRVLLDFDGAMVNATVLVNGQTAARHMGGYLPFSAELTSLLQPGDNVVAVLVDARCGPVPPQAIMDDPHSVDFLQPGGIYRDVRLRLVPDTYLSDVYAQPVNVLSASPGVDITYTLDAAGAPIAPVRITAELSDRGKTVATATRTLGEVPAGQTAGTLTLDGLGGIALWSPASPKLYSLTMTMAVPGLGTHSVRQRTGFREAQFRDDGFFLNGQRLKIFGLDRHQLFPYTGMAMPARVQRRDAEIIKNDFNCNMVRCSHYPQSPHFLDACDELGVMVWEEAPGWHHIGDAAWQDIVLQNVHDMVVRDRSRPSVIIWGTRLNETRGYPGLYRRTRQLARDLDPTRPSTGAMDRYSTEFWAEDVFSFNDYHLTRSGHYRLKPPLPGVPYLVSESVGVELPRPRHYRWTDPPTLLARQALYHAQAHNIAQSDPRYAGLLAWCAFDYASQMGQPWGQNVKWAGVADGFRVAKPAAAIYLSQVDPRVRPVVAPVFFWDLALADSPDGPGPDAMLASNCEQVEVFIGGDHAGTARPVLESELYGHLTYPPTLVDLVINGGGHPDLRIEGYVDGRQVTVVQMSSDPAGDRLAMAADDAQIAGDGSDATRVVFRAVDAYGNQRRYASGEVRLRVTGPGELIGDNPFAFGEYGGLGAVWLRSLPGRSGPVTVTAEHPQLGRARVTISVATAGRQSLD
ncbi:MAG: glycoside hydrolase family 2 protein [Streptosporangiaceae bacterium]